MGKAKRKELNMSNYSVYMLICPNGKRYIGMTMQNPKYRWNDGKGYIQNTELFKDITKYGWNNFEKIIVKTGLNQIDACAVEVGLIEKYKTQDPQYGYNKETGGKPTKLALTTRKKMSVSHIGLLRDETYRKHISESKRGNKNGMFGKFGGLNPGARKVVATNGTEEKTFDSISSACREMNLSKNAFKNVSACCKGKRATAYGFKWRYMDDNQD